MTKKQRIFIEAAKLFQTKGYAATSMRDLADQVGLKPSSFYSHIKSKEEILEIICRQAANVFSEGLTTVLENQTTPIDRLEAIIDLHMEVAFDNPSAITVFNDEWKHLSGEALSNFRNRRKDYQDAVIDIIKLTIENEDLKALDPMIIFNAMIGGTRWLHFISKPSDSMKSKIQTQLKTIFLEGFKK